MSYIAVVIDLPSEDGKVTVRRVTAPSGDQDGLRFLQDSVGGYVEHLYSDDREVDFWLNEEGKLMGMPINNVATDLLWLLNPAFRGADVLVGNVVLTGNDGPETASIPDGFWEVLQVMKWIGSIEFVDEAS